VALSRPETVQDVAVEAAVQFAAEDAVEVAEVNASIRYPVIAEP
jgi:hypothetical protein